MRADNHATAGTPPEGTSAGPLETMLTLTPGEVLFREGDTGDRAYVVRHGRLEVSRRFGSAEVVIAVDGPGTIVGEMALIDDSPRSATVRALETTEVTVIPKEAFQFHLARTDPVTRMLLERFVTIIRSISAENVRLILGIR
ncbi:cyclic nucleotide-binding domain-containing protein [Roseospira visakhapatnamensis]|uniref:CRP-like cAMP-binding protein n=1 Tax=Roseospira visakhapatnamensis TaxID=390880 RepID=A0A7W6W9V1_9PROT|nr:cyclic nucleotide-binding domain-containing protein [Roseospira visakhapatnamensis]MBB4266329.1 CRP-like cAMP-binding protein [Roseospira visakhapatnamensis]